jgi:hypothetical protein
MGLTSGRVVAACRQASRAANSLYNGKAGASSDRVFCSKILEPSSSTAL